MKIEEDDPWAKSINEAYGVHLENMTEDEFLEFAGKAVTAEIEQTGEHADTSYLLGLAQIAGINPESREKLMVDCIEARLKRIGESQRKYNSTHDKFHEYYNAVQGLGYLASVGTKSSVQRLFDYVFRFAGEGDFNKKGWREERGRGRNKSHEDPEFIRDWFIADLLLEKAAEGLTRPEIPANIQIRNLKKLRQTIEYLKENADENTIIKNLEKAEKRFKEKPAKGIKSNAEKLLERAGIRDDKIGEYAERITEKAQRLFDLKFGGGSIYVGDIGDDVVKVNIPRRHKREVIAYTELLPETRLSRHTPEYKDSVAGEEVGMIRLGKFQKNTISLDELLLTDQETRIKYIDHNIKLMVLLHTEFTKKAKEKKIEFGNNQERYNSLSNPDLGLITDGFENERLFSYIKRTGASAYDLAKAEENKKEVMEIIAREGKCVIHGDLKPENSEYGVIHDFNIREGYELEDIMRFLTGYEIQCSKEAARLWVDRYIELRSEIDEEFRNSKERKDKLREYADKFYDYENNVFASRANDKNLEDPKMKDRRLYFLSKMREAA